jgi:Holliday junction resolvase RusA-like endonuclease
MTLFKCSLLLDHHAIKKNSREIHRNWKTGQPFIGKNQKLTVAENILLTKLIYMRNKHRIFEPISEDIQVKFIFYCKNYYTKKNERSKNLPDLENLISLPQDCLQKAEIILNDRLIQSLDGSRIKPGEENRLDIEITKFIE